MEPFLWILAFCGVCAAVLGVMFFMGARKLEEPTDTGREARAYEIAMEHALDYSTWVRDRADRWELLVKYLEANTHITTVKQDPWKSAR